MATAPFLKSSTFIWASVNLWKMYLTMLPVLVRIIFQNFWELI